MTNKQVLQPREDLEDRQREVVLVSGSQYVVVSVAPIARSSQYGNSFSFWIAHGYSVISDSSAL